MEQSSWLSETKFTTMSGYSSSKSLYTASQLQVSAFTKWKLRLPLTLFKVDKLPE